ncbi:MAG: hypothetical protein AAF423_06940 [Pseudomonadota bacterium]
MTSAENAQVHKYFSSLGHALDGLDTFLREDDSPAYKHDVIAAIVNGYIRKLQDSLDSWEDKITFEPKFRVSQTESGFPAFENVLDLQNDLEGAEARLSGLRDTDTLKQAMADHILTHKTFPDAIQKQLAERHYLELVQAGNHFAPLVLPKTVRVSVNPKTRRPYYVVHWGYYDGSANLPMIYMATVEDSSADIVKLLIGPTGKLNKEINIRLPVGGLLNPDLALQFDDFCEKNSAYSLTLSTIATNMDHDFDHLHPKQLRRFVLGPFYHSAFTRHGERVDQILARVRKPENAWLMTWTMQEIFSTHENPAKHGLWSSQPAREEFYINTDDLECARQGVSGFERNALVPHEAYQAIYASGQENEIFNGYKKHVISDGHVLRNL